MPDPQEKPKKKATQATLDSLKSLYKVSTPMEFTSPKASAALGGFDAIADSIRVVPGTEPWVAAHEASHARDFHSRGPIGRAMWHIRSALAMRDSTGTARWPIWTEGLERSAEHGAAAHDIIGKVNESENVDDAEMLLKRLIQSTGPRATAQVSSLSPDKTARRINELIWSTDPNMRGSMIRQAMLKTPYFDDYQSRR